MTTQELVERLRAVGDIKADDAYDGIDPRVVRRMRNVAEVMRAAASRLSEMEAENKRLREALENLLHEVTVKWAEADFAKFSNACDQAERAIASAALEHQQKGEGL